MDKKKEELGKLYSLRAGLSVISQKCDDYQRNQAQIKEKERVINYLSEKVNGPRYYTQSYYYEIQSIKDSLEKVEIEYKKIQEKYSTLLFASILFTLAILPVGIILWIIVAHTQKEYHRIESYLDELKTSYHNYQEWQEIEDKESRDRLKEKIEEDEKDKKSMEEFKKSLVDANNKQIIIKEDSKLIEKALIEKYSSFLDIRDWENLDLVIYYYETRRADSIKEALQLVDVERRNNELINSIQHASNEICNTIATSVKALGEVLIEGFNSLSAQLEAQRVQTMGALQQINDNISGVLTQQTLSNALLAKANVSSKDMVEQMKQLNRKIKSA